jgi:DNA primase
MTSDQAALLKRFTPGVILLYDSDSAGLKATFRAGDECLRHGLRVRVATLPPEEDPDSLVRKGGKAALEPILDDAVDVLERKIQLLERKGWFEGVERRREALDRLLPTVRAASDPIAKDLYLSRVAERVGISRAVLERELAARPARDRIAAVGAPAVPAARPAALPRAERRRRTGARVEARLLRLMLKGGNWLDRARGEVPATRFEVPTFREIFQALVALPAAAPVSDAATALSLAGQDVWQRLAEDASKLEGLDEDAEYAAAVERLEERDLLRRPPPPDDIEARREWLARLSPEARQRLHWQRHAKQSPEG